MKSKPPTKKAKVGPGSPSIEGLPSRNNASPSGSTTSSTSSLLSIPPPTSGGGPRGGGGDVVAKLTSGMAGKGPNNNAATVSVRTASSPPAYPTYVHSDIKEWPKMNVLITCPKGASGTDGKPSATLGAYNIEQLVPQVSPVFSPKDFDHF